MNRAHWSPWHPSSSTPCATSGVFILPIARSSRGSTCPSIPGRRSGSSGPTGRESPRSCGSWPARTTGSRVRHDSRPGSRSGTSRRSHSSTDPRMWRATWLRASVRRSRWSTATTKCVRPSVPRRPTSTRSWPSRPTSRPKSMPPVPGSSTAPSRSPWTPCGSRPETRTCEPSQGVSAAGSRSADCCCPSRTCCCWTSRPTTSMRSRWPGSSGRSRNTRAPSWP